MEINIITSYHFSHFMFLSTCENLVEFDILNLKSIQTIYDYFLENCKHLNKLVLLAIDLKSISITTNGFMENVPKTIEINCNKYLNAYKNVEPWSNWSNNMVGEHDYSVYVGLWDNIINPISIVLASWLY